MCDLNVKAAHRIHDGAEVVLCIGDDPADSMTMSVEEGNNLRSAWTIDTVVFVFIEIKKSRSETSSTPTRPQLFSWL